MRKFGFAYKAASSSTETEFAHPKRVNARTLGDRDDVLEPVRVEARVEGGVVAVGLIGEDRRAGDLPARRPLRQRRRERRLRPEGNLLRDLRLPPPLLVGAPLLGQIERKAERERAAHADCVHRDEYGQDVAIDASDPPGLRERSAVPD